MNGERVMNPIFQELAHTFPLLVRNPKLAISLAAMCLMAYLTNIIGSIAASSGNPYAIVILAATSFASLGVAFWIVREFLRPQ